MRTLRRIGVILAVILILVLFAVNFLSRNYVVPVLTYHSINTHIAKGMEGLAVSPDTFDRQMEFLRSHNYNVIPLENLAALIKDNKKIPPKTIAITFDDGYVDNYTYAFPVLKKYRIPATIFIIINEVGRKERDRLEWEQIKEMQHSGLVTFGSHTLRHERLINIKSPQDLKAEVFESKRILEDKLSQKVNLFSYPEGCYNRQIRQLVMDAGYSAAVATTPGKQSLANDIFLLKRIRISENSRNMFIFAVETSGYYTMVKEYKKEYKDRRNGRK